MADDDGEITTRLPNQAMLCYFFSFYPARKILSGRGPGFDTPNRFFPTSFSFFILLLMNRAKDIGKPGASLPARGQSNRKVPYSQEAISCGDSRL